MSGSRTTATVRRATPLLAAATVLVVLLGVGWVMNRSSTGGPDGAGRPPLLHLAEYHPAAASGPAPDGWRLRGTLPDGPSEAAMRTFGSSSSDRVTALSRSLGFTGPGREQRGVTTFEEPDATLRVPSRSGGQWYFTRGAQRGGVIDCPMSSRSEGIKDPGLPVACSIAPMAAGQAGGPTGTSSSGVDPLPAVATPSVATPSVATPSVEAALALAGPVLAAAGIDASTARATGLLDGVPQVTVVADPEVDGLPSYGMTTFVTVAAGKLAAAGGWLGDPEEGATYPLISAREAWQQLAQTPMQQTLVACPQPRPENVDPLSCSGTVTVSGARLGLSLQHEGSSPVLVPAWLFEVRGGARLLPVVAVDPSYLAGAAGPTDGGGAPGSAGPVQPSPGGAAPGPVSPQPVDPGSRFSAVLPTESGGALVVTFTGGVDDCFDYRVLARETASSVRLSLVEKPVPGKQACIDLAQVYQRRVPLAQPLGDRTVLDAQSGGRVELQSP